jgi:tetratricopeptide (TPR) repeat protein
MDQLATKTLAEIYLRQGYFQEAFEIFKALAEKDPQDMEVQKRLEELREKLHPPSVRLPYPHTKEDKIHHLEKWLENIRKRGKN